MMEKSDIMYKIDKFLRNNIQKADALVYTFTIRDHSMGNSLNEGMIAPYRKVIDEK